MSKSLTFLVVFLVTAVPRAAFAAEEAQQPRREQTPSSLRVSVVDQTGAAIVGAEVTLSDAAGAPQLLTTSDRGEVLFGNLAAGKYQLKVASIGFEPADIPDVNVRRGRQEKREVTLEIGKYVEEIDVTRDRTDERLNDSFSTTLSGEQIDALPDDEEEMAEVLQQMAGPGAQIAVNGFRGGRLPPKSQIQEIRFRFDPYGAEFHEAGFPRVDIATRPGTAEWRNNASFTFRGDEMNARNAFAPTKPDEQARRYQWSTDGPIVKGKTSFALSVGGMDAFESDTILVSGPDGEIRGVVTQPNERLNLNFRLEHALNKAHVLRAEYQRSSNSQQNLGVGQFDVPERAYDRESLGNTLRVSETGTLFGKARNELRVEYSWDEGSSSSLSDAVTLRVPDQFTSGGAQILGGRREREIEIADNFEIPIAKNQTLRTGFLVEGGWYRGDELRNFNGTFTFASLADYEAGRPRQFTRRIGDPLVEFAQWEIGWYLQDDIRLRKNLMLNLGLRYEAQTNFSDNLNFAPRAFMTWSPFKSGTTTVRAGAGVFYDWYDADLVEETLRLDGTRQRDIIIVNPGYPDPSAAGSDTSAAPSIIRTASAMTLPRIQRASVGVEHRFTSWLQVRTNYFVQRGLDEFRSVNINAPINAVRPEQLFANISFLDSVGRSERQGVDVGAMFSYMPRRIFGAINYTLAEADNDADSATSLPVNGTDLAAEWGPARQDVRHRLFANLNLPLAWGLRINTNVRYQSALPYNITTGDDDNGDTVINDRPDGVGRNAARGDASTTVDLRLSWSRGIGKRKNVDGMDGGPQIQIRVPGGGGPGRGPGGGPGGGRAGFGGGDRVNRGDSRVMFELFVDASNVFNAVNYRTFSGVLASSLFGQPLSAEAARRVEVGVRLGF